MSLRFTLALAVCFAPAVVDAQPRGPAPRAPALTDYRVAAGDTCASIALRVYRDVRRTNLIHENNPSLGRPPHRLRPGMVLRLPRAAPRRTEPDAILTETRNVVEIGAPAARRARGSDPLYRGTTVSTGSSSTAEVTFADESQLRLSEQTTVVILGESNTRVRRLARAGDTTLVRGSLRAFLDDLSAPPPPPPSAAASAPPVVAARPARAPSRPIAIRTSRGRVLLGRGEAALSAGEGGAVTLSVYRGESRIQSGTRTVLVREGFAVRAEEGRPLTQRRLPAAPVWVSAPPALVFAERDLGRFEATWRPGESAGNSAPALREWHVQVARDPSFLIVTVDTHLDPGESRVVIPGLHTGRYFVRVSAVDLDRFEGPFTPVAPVRVVNPHLIPTADPYRARSLLGDGLRCGLDGAELTPLTGSLSVDRQRAHTLRCALGDGDAAVETTLPALPADPHTLIARLVVPDEREREGVVRVRVVDHEGLSVDGSSLQVIAPQGVVAGAVRAADEPGLWLVPVEWSESLRSFSLAIRVAGGETLRTAQFELPYVQPPPRPDPLTRRLFARGDLGLGFMLSEFQRNSAPANFGGNTLGIVAGVGASLRLGLDVLRPRPASRGISAGIGLMASTWIYPTGLDTVAVATMYGGGLQAGYTAGRLAPYVDASAGLVLTGAVTRFGVDIGVGLDLRLTRALSIGPVVRYFHVVQPDDLAFPEDARTLSAGLALTLRGE